MLLNDRITSSYFSHFSSAALEALVLSGVAMSANASLPDARISLPSPDLPGQAIRESLFLLFLLLDRVVRVLLTFAPDCAVKFVLFVRVVEHLHRGVARVNIQV
jgi:hypothetical protein